MATSLFPSIAQALGVYNPNPPTIHNTVPVTTTIQNSQLVTWNGPVAAGSTNARKKSKAWLALYDLQRIANHRNLSNVSMHYRHLPVDEAIGKLGSMNPIMNGRPCRWVLPLLMCANSPYRFKEQRSYIFAGLCFVAQANPLGRMTKVRLTVAGLELLKHLSKRKSFKPFFDSFVSKKAEASIYQACFDFEMNVMPEFIQKDHIRLAENKAKKDARALLAMQEQARAWYSTVSSQPLISTGTPYWQTNTMPLIAQSAHQQNTAAYYAALNNVNLQNQQVSNEAHHVASALRSMAGALKVNVIGNTVTATDRAGTVHQLWPAK